jgi:hypothetical protein
MFVLAFRRQHSTILRWQIQPGMTSSCHWTWQTSQKIHATRTAGLFSTTVLRHNVNRRDAKFANWSGNRQKMSFARRRPTAQLL